MSSTVYAKGRRASLLEIKWSGDSEILHEIVRDNTRKSESMK